MEAVNVSKFKKCEFVKGKSCSSRSQEFELKILWDDDVTQSVLKLAEKNVVFISCTSFVKYGEEN